jgi:hypothetical protein
VSFPAISLCVASQGGFIVVVVYFVMTQSGNFGYTLIEASRGNCELFSLDTNACYYSEQTLLSSRLISKNLKIKYTKF